MKIISALQNTLLKDYQRPAAAVQISVHETIDSTQMTQNTQLKDQQQQRLVFAVEVSVHETINSTQITQNTQLKDHLKLASAVQVSVMKQ